MSYAILMILDDMVGNVDSTSDERTRRVKDAIWDEIKKTPEYQRATDAEFRVSHSGQFRDDGRNTRPVGWGSD